MGRVLSQGEIDNLLANLLNDSTVLPEENEQGAAPGAGTGATGECSGSGANGTSVPAPAIPVEPEIPAGIAAFKAKIAAMKQA